ncbi:hypothetical protein AAY473_016386 [Plecturocebus cupreus]
MAIDCAISRQDPVLLPRLDCSSVIWAHCSLNLLGWAQLILPLTPLKDGVRCVAQSGLQLLCSGDTSTLASQNGVLLCHPGCSAVVRSQLTATSASWVQAILPASASSSWDYRCLPDTWLIIFVFLVEMGFHDVDQAGLKLLTSGDLPAFTSQTYPSADNVSWQQLPVSAVAVSLSCSRFIDKLQEVELDTLLRGEVHGRPLANCGIREANSLAELKSKVRILGKSRGKLPARLKSPQQASGASCRVQKLKNLDSDVQRLEKKLLALEEGMLSESPLVPPIYCSSWVPTDGLVTTYTEARSSSRPLTRTSVSSRNCCIDTKKQCFTGRLGSPRFSQVQASASRVAGITGVHHYSQLIFVFLVETGFNRVGQAGLELLTLGDLPTSASQSAGIIGRNHHVRSIKCHCVNRTGSPSGTGGGRQYLSRSHFLDDL